MKVRLAKDWSFHKAGDVADVYEPMAKNWIASGIAEPISPEPERRDLPVERADEPVDDQVERAVRKHTARRR
jgi:hypothetical protein